MHLRQALDQITPGPTSFLKYSINLFSECFIDTRSALDSVKSPGAKYFFSRDLLDPVVRKLFNVFSIQRTIGLCKLTFN